jgi:hypothetical protein
VSEIDMDRMFTNATAMHNSYGGTTGFGDTPTQAFFNQPEQQPEPESEPEPEPEPEPESEIPQSPEGFVYAASVDSDIWDYEINKIAFSRDNGNGIEGWLAAANLSRTFKDLEGNLQVYSETHSTFYTLTKFLYATDTHLFFETNPEHTPGAQEPGVLEPEVDGGVRIITRLHCYTSEYFLSNEFISQPNPEPEEDDEEDEEEEEPTPTPPVLTFFSPQTDNIYADSTIFLRFDQDMTTYGGTITIHKSSDDSVLQTIQASSTNVTFQNDLVAVQPVQDLPVGESLYMNIPPNVLYGLNDNGYGGIDSSSGGSGAIIFTVLSR